MIFNPPAIKNGTLIKPDTDMKALASTGDTDAPIERAMVVIPEAAERSSGATTAIV